MKTTKCS